MPPELNRTSKEIKSAARMLGWVWPNGASSGSQEAMPVEDKPPEDAPQDTNGDDPAQVTPLPDDGSHQQPENVALDMNNIEVKESAKGADGATEVALTTLRQVKLSRANSDAMSARTSGAGGGGNGINSNDYKMMAKHAKSLSRSSRLGAGTKTAYQASMADIGALGIGLQLYFMLTKYLSFAFLIMGMIALPTIILNDYGHGITSKMSDPLQLAYASLGNEGVNDAFASDPKLCLPMGNIDCNWTTVDTPFTTDPVKVSWIITISDCLYSIFFLFFYGFIRVKATQAIETHRTENLTPAKYAVCVRGLPKDATEEEILRHFNNLYDLTKDEEYSPLWFGCCWGRRKRVKHSQSKKAVNRSVVSNLDHLAITKSINKKLYLGTWIAEVSVGHPTGGLLRAFLSMEALTQSIAETRTLISTLNEEKRQSPSTFKPRDEKLIQSSQKRLDKLILELEKKKSKIKELEQATPEKARKKAIEAAQPFTGSKKEIARAKMNAAAKAAKTAATNTQRAFDWEACDCAFVVFNNQESRRRCLQDYRKSIFKLPRKFQPKLLRFRDGRFPLIVVPAPEPSNILWENLEVTDRGRFYRRSLTYLVTLFLLFVSAMIISAAQSAQQQFADKLPISGLCETKLPQVFYGSPAYNEKKTRWKLAWDASAQCSAGSASETRYHIAYENGIVNAFNFSNPVVVSDPANAPQRCVDPCVSEDSNEVCSTLPCFDKDLQEDGESCETYLASHVLYCYCSTALADSITNFGYVDGPKMLWRDYIPCHGYIKDYAKKNGFIVMAAAVVILINVLMDAILRAFADFERHYSESSKASGIAIKLFAAQFLNTAIVVLLVNASLGLKGVPVINELLKGKYRDFERDWYPTVGMGITTTMLINAFMPQIQLFIQMFVVSPCKRELQRRRIRTQDQMNKLYAGPAFDISSRYPTLLNSVFVTMVFCGGSPILLFIAAVSAAGTYWFDKLSIVHLYSVKTAYDEELGEVALSLLPWTLVLHLAFSTWMYGNPQLMKSHLLDIAWVLRNFGMKSILSENPGASNEVLYEKFLEKSSSIDVMGKYGFIVKVLRSDVMLVFLFFVGAVLVILLSTVWLQVFWPVITKTLTIVYRSICLSIFRSSDSPDITAREDNEDARAKNKKRPVVIPEYTDYFRKSVPNTFRPDTDLGFERNEDGELIRKWQENYSYRGVKRVVGQPMRTWEAMQAASTRSYAIETNEKYQLAVAEIIAASKLLRLASMKPGSVAPMVSSDKDDDVLQAVVATDAVEISEKSKAAEAKAASGKWKALAPQDSCDEQANG
ncbi:hypothetical protein Gpo141_00012806 [Globisporangium polare]